MSIATLLGAAARHAAAVVSGRRAPAMVALRSRRSAGRRTSTTISEPLESRQYLTAVVGDPGFETVGVGTGYQYDPSGSAWAFSGSSGVTGNGNAFTSGNPNAPQGTQVAFVQVTGAMTQSISGWAAGSYQLSFQAAQRGNNSAGGEDFQVLVDGAAVGTFRPASTAYGLLSTTFTVAAGTHTVEFLGLDTAGGDNTAFIDNVQLQANAILTGTAGNDAFMAVANGANVDLYVNATPGTGSPVQSVAASDLSSIILAGGGGTDTFTSDVPGLGLTVASGTVQVTSALSLTSLSVGPGGTLDMPAGSSAALTVAAQVTVSGTFDHAAGAIITPSLTVQAGGTFVDAGGSVAAPSGSSLAVSVAGLFDAATSASLASASGSLSLTSGGTYEVDNGGGSGTTTPGMSVTVAGTGGIIDVTAGTLSMPGGISDAAGSMLTLDGSGTLSIATWSVNEGTVVQTAGAVVVPGGMGVGESWGGDAAYDLSGGTLTVGGAFYIGSFSTGTFTQTGGTLVAYHTELGSNWGNGLFSQTGGSSSLGEVFLGFDYGDGRMDLSGGQTTAGDLGMGQFVGGTGEVDLAGTADLAVAGSETLGAAGPGGAGTIDQTGGTNTCGFLGVGGYGGQGAYTLSGGILSTQSLYVGNQGRGTFTQSGGTAAGGLEVVGNSPSGAGALPGTGSITETGGTNNVGASGLFLGIGDGSAGSYDLAGGTLSDQSSFLYVGVEGPDTGNYEQTGGAAGFAAVVLGIGGTATGTVSGGTLAISGNAYVGYTGPATLSIGGTAVVTDANNALYVSGDGVVGDPAGVGTLDLSGSAQLTTQQTYVGYSGPATFAQTGGTDTAQTLVLNGPTSTTASYHVAVGTVNITTAINLAGASADGPGVVNEGSPYTLGLFGDGSTTAWQVGWGDGTTSALSTDPSSTTHTYTAGGNTYTVTPTAYDGTTAHSANSVPVLVNDVPASVGTGGTGVPIQSVPVGQMLTVTEPFTDPGTSETHTALVNWGDGTSSTATVTEANGSGTITASHVYTLHGTDQALLSVTDSGGAVALVPFTVHVAYVAPTLSVATSSTAVTAGDTATLTLHDAGPESPTAITNWSVNWGDGSAAQTVTTPPDTSNPGDAVWTVTHTYAAGGMFTATATATDSAGSHAAGTVTFAVAGIPATPALSGGGSVAAGATYTLGLSATAASSEPGDAIQSWTINWGDGTAASPDVQVIAGNAASATHSYTSGAAVVTISATVADAAGVTSAAATKAVTITYPVPAIPALPIVSAGDPSGGDLVYALSNGSAPTAATPFAPSILSNETAGNATSTTTTSNTTDARGYSQTSTAVTTASVQVVETVDATGGWTYVETFEQASATTTVPSGDLGTTETDGSTYDYTFTASGGPGGGSTSAFTSTQTYDDVGSADWAATSGAGIESDAWAEVGDHQARITSGGTDDQSGHDVDTADASAPFASVASGVTFAGTMSQESSASDAYSFANSTGTRTELDSSASQYSGAGPYVDDDGTASISGSGTVQGSDASGSTTALAESWDAADGQWVVTADGGTGHQTIISSSSFTGSGPVDVTASAGESLAGQATDQGSDASTKVYDWVLGLNGSGTLTTTGGTGVLTDAQHENGTYEEAGTSVDVQGSATVTVGLTDSGTNDSDTSVAIGETLNPSTGQWVENTGSGTSDQTVLSESDYSGSGPDGWVDDGGDTWAGTASESGSDTNLSGYLSALTLDVATGQMRTASGAGSTTDDRTDASSYTAGGRYVDVGGGASIAGTQGESGSDDSASNSTLDESWDPAAQTWSATAADGSDAEAVVSSGSYAGQGSYSTTDTLGNTFTGTADESGTDGSSADYLSDYGLGAGGQVAVVGGTGTVADTSADTDHQQYGATAWVGNGGDNTFTGTNTGSSTDGSDSDSTLHDTWSGGQWVPTDASGTAVESVSSSSSYGGTDPDDFWYLGVTGTAGTSYANGYGGTVHESGNATDTAVYDSNLGLASGGQVGVTAGTATFDHATTDHSDYGDSAKNWYDASGDLFTGTATYSGSEDDTVNTTLDDTWEPALQGWVDDDASGTGGGSATDGFTYNGTAPLSYTATAPLSSTNTAGTHYTGSLVEVGNDTTVSSYSDSYGLGTTGGAVVNSGNGTVSDTRGSDAHSHASGPFHDNTTLSSVGGSAWVDSDDTLGTTYTLHQTWTTATPSVTAHWTDSSVNGTATEHVSQSSGYNGSGDVDYVDTVADVTYDGDANENGGDTAITTYTSSPGLAASQGGDPTVAWGGAGTLTDTGTDHYDFSGSQAATSDDDGGDDDDAGPATGPSIGGSQDADHARTVHYALGATAWLATDGTGTSDLTASNVAGDHEANPTTTWTDASSDTLTGSFTSDSGSTLTTVSHLTQTLAAGNSTWATSAGNSTVSSHATTDGTLDGTLAPYTSVDGSGAAATTLVGTLHEHAHTGTSTDWSLVNTYGTAGGGGWTVTGGGHADTTTESYANSDGTVSQGWTAADGDGSVHAFSGDLVESVGATQTTVYHSNLTVGADGQLHADDAATSDVTSDQWGAANQSGTAAYTFVDSAGDDLTGTLTVDTGVRNDASTWLSSTWNGTDAWTTTSAGTVSTQYVTSAGGYSGSGPSTWTDQEGEHLSGTATDAAQDAQVTTYSNTVTAGTTLFSGGASDSNSGLYTYQGSADIDIDAGYHVTTGTVYENGTAVTGGTTTETLSYVGESWQVAGGSGSATQTNTAYRDVTETDLAASWADDNGSDVTGPSDRTISEAYGSNYSWSLAAANGSFVATQGAATVSQSSTDVTTEDGTGDYLNAVGIGGIEVDTRTVADTSLTNTTATLSAGNWQLTGGGGTQDEKTEDLADYYAEEPYANDLGPSGARTWDGETTASTDLDLTLALDTATGGWDDAAVSGHDAYGGYCDQTYGGTNAGVYAGADALGTVTGSETESVTDDLTFTFSATPSLAAGGGVSWSGTGTVGDVTTATDTFNAHQSVAVAQTTDGGDDDDGGDDGYASTTVDSDVYTESDTQTDHSSVQTDYQMTPGTYPAGTWRATETDATDSLTGSDMGSLHESLYYEYGTGTDDDWWTTDSADDASQSGSYHQTGSLHTTWDAAGNATVTGGYGGGSQQAGLWTYHEVDESADDPGADTTVEDDSQGYAFHDTFGLTYGNPSTVSAENDGWQTGSVVTDDDGTLQPEQDSSSTPSDTFDYPHFYADGPGTPSPLTWYRLTGDSPGYPNVNYLPHAPTGTQQASLAAAPYTPAPPPPAAGVLGSATPTVVAPSVAAPVSTTPTAAPAQPAGGPASVSSSSYTPASTNLFTYLPGIVASSVVNGLTEFGARVVDGANDALFLYTDGELGSSNLALSNLSQAQLSGQVSWLNAQTSTIPVVGNAVNAITGTDLLTGQPLNGWQVAGAAFGAVADAAFLLAGGIKFFGGGLTVPAAEAGNAAGALADQEVQSFGSIGRATEAIPRILSQGEMDNLVSALKELDPEARIGYYSRRGNWAGFETGGIKVAFAYPEGEVPAGVAYEEFQHAFDAVADPEGFIEASNLANLSTIFNDAYHVQVFARMLENPLFEMTATESNALFGQLMKLSDVSRL